MVLGLGCPDLLVRSLWYSPEREGERFDILYFLSKHEPKTIQSLTLSNFAICFFSCYHCSTLFDSNMFLEKDLWLQSLIANGPRMPRLLRDVSTNKCQRCMHLTTAVVHVICKTRGTSERSNSGICCISMSIGIVSILSIDCTALGTNCG